MSRTLLTELPHDFLAKPRGLCEDVVEPVEHLFQIFSVDRGTVGHSCGKDYVILLKA